jgi:hypothetical protein
MGVAGRKIYILSRLSRPNTPSSSLARTTPQMPRVLHPRKVPESKGSLSRIIPHSRMYRLYERPSGGRHLGLNPSECRVTSPNKLADDGSDIGRCAKDLIKSRGFLRYKTIHVLSDGNAIACIFRLSCGSYWFISKIAESGIPH